MSDIDIDVEDLIDEDPESTEFDPAWGSSVFHSEISSRCANALNASTAELEKLTTNVFVKDAIHSAVFLRNMCGDVDAVVADHCENIKNNLMVVLTEINKDPVSFIGCIAQAIPNPADRKAWLLSVGQALIDASEQD